MEKIEIWGLLSALVIFVAGRLLQRKGTEKKITGMDEAFPTLNNPSMPNSNKQTIAQKKKTFNRQNQIISEKENPDNTQHTQPIASEIKMESADDARKAFIYSEIFRRKY